MAYEFTKAHPGMSVTVFDLSAVIEMREHFLPANSDKKVSFVAGRLVFVFLELLHRF